MAKAAARLITRRRKAKGESRKGLINKNGAEAPFLMSSVVSHQSSRISLEFEYVESVVAVREIDQAALVHVDVVALRAGLARGGLGDEVADFLGRAGFLDVDDAEPPGEPRAVHQRVAALHVLLELVRAEAPRRGAAPGR